MAVVPVASLELEGNAAYRYGGRLFLMPCDREDQRRKTDEHERICKHISVCNHRAPPLKEVDNLAVLTGSRIIAQSAAPCQFAALGRLFLFRALRAAVLDRRQLGQAALVDEDVRHLHLELRGHLLKLRLAEDHSLCKKHCHHFFTSFL